MQRLKTLTILTILFLAFTAESFSSGYNIKVQIDGLQDTTLMLAYHFGNRKYIKDTIAVDSQGAGVFTGDQELPGGIYLVVMPDMNYFELIIDREQEFKIETTIENPVRDIKVDGSLENQMFIEYHRFMNQMQSASANIQERLEMNRNIPDSVQYLQSVGRAMDQEVKDYWNEIINDNPGTLLASLLQAMQNPEMPEFEIPAGTENPDSLRWSMGYEYNRDHFFDNIDFSDERLLRTPVLHNKLEHFFSRTLIQRPDFIIPEAIRVVELSKANDNVFQYVLVFLLNHYERSQIMGLDEVFVELAERYYLTGEAFWANEPTIEKLRERVERVKPTLIGRKASEMEMLTPEGNRVSLHNVDAEYTVVYFYEPTCGHCKVVTPRLNELQNKYRGQGLKVWAVYIYGDAGEWKEYISTNDLDWINVYDPQNSSRFRDNYDVYSTPTIYILDSDKKIIAKRIGIDTVEQMLEELL